MLTATGGSCDALSNWILFHCFFARYADIDVGQLMLADFYAFAGFVKLPQL